jgi:hypothetical protein
MPAPYPTELEQRLKAAYGNHKHIAIKRGIPFLFAFEQWSEWWLTDDRWSRRGRKAGQLQMSRKGDRGPYSPDNVDRATQRRPDPESPACACSTPRRRAGQRPCVLRQPAQPPLEPMRRRSSRVTWCPWEKDAPGGAEQASRYRLRWMACRAQWSTVTPATRRRM